MSINFYQDDLKHMTKEARKIIEGTYNIVSKYQPDVWYDIPIVEVAARRCTVAKYLTVAKQWVKVPKKKPLEEWVEGLRSFHWFFEKVGQKGKGLSEQYRNREDCELPWNPHIGHNFFGDVYKYCSNHLPMDWSSYHDMDKMIEWSIKYSIDEISSAFCIAEQQCAISVAYIDGILKKQEIMDAYDHAREACQINQIGNIASFDKLSRSEDELKKELQIQSRIEEELRIKEEEEKLKKIFVGLNNA